VRNECDIQIRKSHMSCPHAQLRLTNCSFRSLGERPKENSMRQGNFAELMPIFVGFEGPVRLQAQEGKTRYCDFISSCSFSMSPGPRILQKANNELTYWKLTGARVLRQG
jgi:hypothetical protein